MDHELLDHKTDFFTERDEPYSSLKHEFSRIFHENNLHSFTNASDIGFLDLGKASAPGFSADYEDHHGVGDMGNLISRSFPKEIASPRGYMGMGMGMDIHNSYSPMRFLQSNLASNVNYNTGYANLGAHGLYQQHQPYQYGDYSYLDYSTQPNSAYLQNLQDIYNQPDTLDNHTNNPLSLMWSNETAKNMNVKDLADEDTLPTTQAALSKRFTSVPAEQFMPKKTPVKVEQDFENALTMKLDRAVKSVPNDTINAAPRRTTRVTKTSYKDTNFVTNEEESGSDDDKDEGYGGDGKSRSSRGLRVLSNKVRDIVSKKKKTTYKEVAEALLQDLNEKLKGKSQSEIAKEEQNVKRRVYDALNVLIAADILRKEGKLVCATNSTPSQGSNKKKGKNNDREDLLDQIDELKKRRKEKMEALQELVFKSLAIKNLIQQNKEKKEKELEGEKLNGNNISKGKKGKANVTPTATKIVGIQNSGASKGKDQDVIRFPFIVLVSSSNDNAMNLNMDASQKQLSIDSKKPFNIFGDIDVLLKMKLHCVPKEMFNKEVPKELQKFISQSFTDTLK